MPCVEGEPGEFTQKCANFDPFVSGQSHSPIHCVLSLFRVQRRAWQTVASSHFLSHIPALLNTPLQSTGGDINWMRAADLNSWNSPPWLAGRKGACRSFSPNSCLHISAWILSDYSKPIYCCMAKDVLTDLPIQNLFLLGKNYVCSA